MQFQIDSWIQCPYVLCVTCIGSFERRICFLVTRSVLEMTPMMATPTIGLMKPKSMKKYLQWVVSNLMSPLSGNQKAEKKYIFFPDLSWKYVVAVSALSSHLFVSPSLSLKLMVLFKWVVSTV